MSLALDVRRAATLQRAWFAIRANAASSKSGKSKKEAADFDYALSQNIKRIQDKLRAGYAFARPHGALKVKKSGTGKRGLVIAPIEDRVVQRAILDVLQDHHATAIRSVLETPTSFGGIPGRGVADAIGRIEKARRDEEIAYLAGSDISGFFTKIKVEPVVEFVASATGDRAFGRLFHDALRVDLANASDMSPEDLALFPRAGIGVAQGCPLSAFAGNVFLREFDAAMNQGGAICLRYIDDFVLLCRSKAEAQEAFEKARCLLEELALTIYDPAKHPDKAFIGPFSSDIHFLGHKLVPGKYPPTEANIASLIHGIELDIAGFHTHVCRLREHRRANRRQSFVATLSAIDQRIMAWSGAFRASTCEATAARVDDEIDRQVAKLISMYSRAKASGSPRRKLFGVHSVLDGMLIAD